MLCPLLALPLQARAEQAAGVATPVSPSGVTLGTAGPEEPPITKRRTLYRMQNSRGRRPDFKSVLAIIRLLVRSHHEGSLHSSAVGRSHNNNNNTTTHTPTDAVLQVAVWSWGGAQQPARSATAGAPAAC